MNVKTELFRILLRIRYSFFRINFLKKTNKYQKYECPLLRSPKILKFIDALPVLLLTSSEIKFILRKQTTY